MRLQVKPLLNAALSALAFVSLSLPASAETVRVFAATSLKEAFQEIGKSYQRAHPRHRVEFNFAGTQILRTQITQGAPADVFASADMEHVAALQREGRVPAFRVFARNRLVVVTPAKNPRVRQLQDLARPGIKVIVAGPSVPAGRYTAQVLSRMSRRDSFGKPFRAQVQRNIVSRETNVRAVLAKVALGEADAGFVYATDLAALRGRVRALPLPPKMNVITSYPIALVEASRNRAGAEAFITEVLSPRGKAILKRRGFLP